VRSQIAEDVMKLSMNAYIAGLGTAALAIAAGFGGGVLIADRVDTHSAPPAAGMSRIERTRREEAKPAPATETTAQASPSEDATINPLAEATRLRVGAADEANGVGHIVEKPSPPVPPTLPQTLPQERQASDAALPAAIQSISQSVSSPPAASPRRTRHARSDSRPRVADEPSLSSRKPVDDGARRDHSRNAGGPREVARYREGGVRYVVRTENGTPANPAEVEQLKRELRARRAGRVAETDAMSYAPERRSGFLQIFQD
jgi:hypothetical protein